MCVCVCVCVSLCACLCVRVCERGNCQKSHAGFSLLLFHHRLSVPELFSLSPFHPPSRYDVLFFSVFFPLQKQGTTLIYLSQFLSVCLCSPSPIKADSIVLRTRTAHGAKDAHLVVSTVRTECCVQRMCMQVLQRWLRVKRKQNPSTLFIHLELLPKETYSTDARFHQYVCSLLQVFV